jgi:hypothetical protein
MSTGLDSIPTLTPNTLSVRKIGSNLEFSVLPQGKNTGILSLDVFSANGAIMARFKSITDHRIVWNIADRNISKSLFFVKAELPDRKFVTCSVIFAE